MERENQSSVVEVERTKEVVLRNYIPRDTPENVYLSLRGYHYLVLGVFAFWTMVRVATIAGKHYYSVSQTAESLMPVEIRGGSLGALICVLFAAFNLITAVGLASKESWGWWLALIGLTWGIVQGLGDGLIAVYFSQSALVSAFHVAIGLAMCLALGWLIYIHLSPGMRVKFEVSTKTEIASAVGIAGGVILGVCFVAWVWSAQVV
ncbi:MAG: hypothetical protein ACKOOI_00195 [Pirellula sp.]